MKTTRFTILLIAILTIAFYSCSDDNSPGGSSSNNNSGGSNTGGCSGGPTTVTDIDGNVYNVVTIGNQCWTKENLRTTHYNNGTPITTGLTSFQWSTTISGAYTDYNNDPNNGAVYGKLYNWYAVANPAGLCPVGWHVPENSEWNQLVKNLDTNADTSTGGEQSLIAGGFMKEASLTYWASPNTGATNSSGFTGLPGGVCAENGLLFYGINQFGGWWAANQYSASFVYNIQLDYDNSHLGNYFNKKSAGESVRCVRD